MTYMRAWMSLKFGQIRLMVSMARDRVIMEKNGVKKHEYLCNQWADHNEILSEASLGWGKAALGLGPDRIQTMVSMATNSSHRVIIEKTVLPLFLGCFLSYPFHTCR